MSLSVMMFGRLADIAGNSITINNPGDTDKLVEELRAAHPLLADLKFRIAVNKQIITDNTKIENGSEVALLPPFSGG